MAGRAIAGVQDDNGFVHALTRECLKPRAEPEPDAVLRIVVVRALAPRRLKRGLERPGVRALSRQAPAEAVCAFRPGDGEAELRRAGEPIAERRQTVTDLPLQALASAIVAVGRQPVHHLAREQRILAAGGRAAEALAQRKREAEVRGRRRVVADRCLVASVD